MTAHNRTRHLYGTIPALSQFADAHLSKGFETVEAAQKRRLELLAIFEKGGHLGYPYQAYKRCSREVPCNTVGCPVCDRVNRMAEAADYDELFMAMKAKGARLLTVNIIPKGCLLTAEELMAFDWVQACNRYNQGYRRHIGNLRTFIRLSADVSHELPDGKFQVHCHGVLAVWGVNGLKKKPLYRLLRRRLKASFGYKKPHLAKGTKKKPSEAPVKLKEVTDLPNWLTYMAKSLFKQRGQTGLGKFKTRGHLLGQLEIPIRVFLSRIKRRRRYLEIGTHREVNSLKQR